MAEDISRRKFVAGTIRLALVSQIAPLDRVDVVRAFSRLAPAERRTLRAAVDALIPGEAPMPAASAVGAARYIERVALGEPPLLELLVRGLYALEADARRGAGASFAAAGADQQHAVLANLEQTQPQAFAALRDATYEAYYTRREVWKRLGYTFRSSRRPTARLERFDERLLARVRSMGPLYREVL